jgi:hypothetical protein
MGFRGRLVAGATIGLACTTAASCTSIFGLDGFRNAAESLCDKLEACDPGKHPDCRQHINTSLDAASPGARQKWLEQLRDTGALDTCNEARHALDTAPICHENGFGCGYDSHCCGFTKSESSCKKDRGCCRTDGVKCKSAGECCSDICSDDGSKNTTCGGKKCALANEKCKNDGDCCSDNCDDKTSVCVQPCLDKGKGCTLASDCCTKHCSDNLCVCLADGQPCESPVECCSNACNNKKCETPLNCTPLNSACNNDKPCCNKATCGGEGKCCVANGGECGDGGSANCCNDGCVDNRCCAELKSACAGAGDCCRGSCTDTATGKVCCYPPECGSPCAQNNAPLDYQTCNNDFGKCILEVCAIDPACCCAGWGHGCVSIATGLAAKKGNPCYLKCFGAIH